VIESQKNERVKRYRRLLKRNFRYRESLFIAEGLQCVREALYSDLAPECILCNSRGLEALQAYGDIIEARSIPCFTVSDAVVEALTSTVTPQGVLAVCPMLHRSLEELLSGYPSLLLLVDRVRDPGNLGNIIRVADAAGVGGMVICEESVDPYNPKAVRSTAGSLFHVPFSVGVEAASVMQLLKEHEYEVVAADPRGGKGVWEFSWPPRVALVVGNEAWGIPEGEEAVAGSTVRVPILGKAESLNVAAATAVILYEIQRCRAVQGMSGGAPGG